MSSGFVSGGSLEQPAERDDAWKKAQEELEAKRKSKEEASQQNNGKSLYEVLEANKAAKQEAFEESNRLKNQFRAIDEDEADFLESVLESTRAREDAIKKETAESLAVFRKQQEEKERAALGLGDSGSPVDEEEIFTFSGKKRKKGKQKEFLKGIKLRKTSSAGSPGEAITKNTTDDNPGNKEKAENTATPLPPKAIPSVASSDKKPASIENPVKAPRKASASPVVALGLGNYSSDEDD